MFVKNDYKAEINVEVLKEDILVPEVMIDISLKEEGPTAEAGVEAEEQEITILKKILRLIKIVMTKIMIKI